MANGVTYLPGNGSEPAFLPLPGAVRCHTFHDIMPKRRKIPTARLAPIQLPLLAEAASLTRIRPEGNKWC